MERSCVDERQRGSREKCDQSIAALSEKMPGTALGKTPDSRDPLDKSREPARHGTGCRTRRYLLSIAVLLTANDNAVMRPLRGCDGRRDLFRGSLGKTPAPSGTTGHDDIMARQRGPLIMRHRITPVAAAWNAHRISSGNRRADGPRIATEPCCAGPGHPSRCGCADGFGAACGRRDHPHEGLGRGKPCVPPWPWHCGIGPEWHPLGADLPGAALLMISRLQTSLLRAARLRTALPRNAPWSRAPGAP